MQIASVYRTIGIQGINIRKRAGQSKCYNYGSNPFFSIRDAARSAFVPIYSHNTYRQGIRYLYVEYRNGKKIYAKSL